MYKVVLRPYLGCACCYQPSCSNYAFHAFKNHHFLKAICLTVYRVLRCHPFCEGGFDPVPGVKKYER